MIEAIARALNLRYYSNSDGAVIALLLGEDIGSWLTVELCLEGKEHNIYAVRVGGGRYFPPDDWPRLLGLANQWHIENRWPRITLVHMPQARYAELQCDAQLHLSDGVHQALLTRFTDHTIAAAYDFWIWLHQQHPVSPLLTESDVNQLELDLGTDQGVFGT